MVGQGGFEPPTSRLSSARSNQLSYKPDEASSSSSRTCGANHDGKRKGNEDGGKAPIVLKEDVGIARERSETSILRKEVIQPQVPLRLPCYDFTPIIAHTLGACLLAVSAPS